MKNKLIYRVILTTAFFALSVQSTLAMETNTPPPNNLGKQIVARPPPQIVFPDTSEIIDEAIDDIESLQLNSKQINRMKSLNIEREKSLASPYVSPAEPVTRTLFVSLDPGMSPPVLRLAQGQQTSIVFSDFSGNPWYIDYVSLNLNLFSNTRNNNDKASNVLTLEALRPAAYGNVTVTLKGLATPVIFVLTSAQKQVDMRVDAKIPGHNPDTLDEIYITSLPAIDGSLSYFLDGVPPREAKRLKVTGLQGVDAWLYQDAMYVRTAATAQYPAYIAAARSTSGVAVYRFQEMYNSITLLSGGQAVTVFLERGRDDK